MNDTAKAAANNSNLGSYMNSALNTAAVLDGLKSSNTTGGQRLASLIGLIMSWGASGIKNAASGSGGTGGTT